MGDKRHEIPAPMLDAATAAMMALQGTDGCIATQDLAEAALEAARVPEMQARIAELEAKLREVVQSKDVAMPIELDEEITELLKRGSAEVSE